MESVVSKQNTISTYCYWALFSSPSTLCIKDVYSVGCWLVDFIFLERLPIFFLTESVLGLGTLFFVTFLFIGALIFDLAFWVSLLFIGFFNAYYLGIIILI